MARKGRKNVARLCVDEKACGAGQSYVTLVYDALRGCVELMTKDRTTKSLEEYLLLLDSEQLQAIESFSMDMWPAYLQAVMKHVPEAEMKIVIDRFHVMKYANGAVDKVRQDEHRELLQKDDKSLIETRYIWRYTEKNLPERYQGRLKELRKMNLKVGKAWALKEYLRLLWECSSPEVALKFFNNWYAWAIRARLPALKKLRANGQEALAHNHQLLQAPYDECGGGRTEQ